MWRTSSRAEAGAGVRGAIGPRRPALLPLITLLAGCFGGLATEPERAALEVLCPGPSMHGDGVVPSACLELGLGLAGGRWGAVDRAGARQRFLWGCDAGQPSACVNVGIYERDGIGGPVATAAARAHFETACRAGQGEGCVAASALESSVELLRIGCETGHGASCGALGAALLEQDAAGANRAWEQGCRAGDPQSCYSRAVSRARGRGEAPDPAQAAQELEPLCSQGLGRACTLAGRLLDRDPLPWARRGCEAGDGAGCWVVGQSLDGEERAAWTQKACALGFSKACP